MWLAHFQTSSCVKVEATRSGLRSAEWSKLPTTFSPLSSSLISYVPFSFSRDICFLFFSPTWTAMISDISQLLCLFVVRGDNVAGVLECTSSLSLVSFLHFLTLPPILSPLVPRRLTCTPHTSQRLAHPPLPYFISPSSFLPPALSGDLPHLVPPFLSHLSLLHRFADSWKTEHKSSLFITRHCTLRNPNRPFPLTLCKGPYTHTHTHKLAWFGNEGLAHTCPRQTSKQSAAREQCVDSQLILIMWLCAVQYFFLYYMKTNPNAHRSQIQVKCLHKEENIRSGRVWETAVVILPSHAWFCLFIPLGETRRMLSVWWSSLEKLNYVTFE